MQTQGEPSVCINRNIRSKSDQRWRRSLAAAVYTQRSEMKKKSINSTKTNGGARMGSAWLRQSATEMAYVYHDVCAAGRKLPNHPIGRCPKSQGSCQKVARVTAVAVVHRDVFTCPRTNSPLHAMLFPDAFTHPPPRDQRCGPLA